LVIHNYNGANGAPLDGNSSYDKLTGHSTSKNNLVVANAQDASINSDGSLSSVSINRSSSEGPTDDYRIKPDITGNGTGVYSTYASSDTAYNSITGTSMASPNVAGSLLLLQQHYNNLNSSFMRASTLKGIALRTADDAGPSGPDAVYGWGLMNTKAAAEAISNNGNESKIEELILNNGQTYSVTVNSDGSSPLIASISWTDRAGTATTATNASTAVLVNDLDIRVTKNSTTYSPYRLTSVTTNGTGDNTVDPYERIDVANASGSYTITVTNKGSLVGGSQNFSLIVTGLTGGTQGDTQAPTTPNGLTASNIAETTLTLSWNAATDNVAVTAYDVYQGSTVLGSVTGTSANVTGLTANTSYQFSIKAKDAADNESAFSNIVTVTTTSGSTGNGCTSGISSFPYNEGFENTLGDWTQSSADDINWSVDSNGTPSNNTGPSSATQGSYYIFVEASGNGTGYPNKQALLNSPCFDLSSLTEANFSFRYHMNGATDMGSIAVDASTDNGATWTTLWNETGTKGNSWLEANIDLAAYVGGGVQLRFNRITGSTWQADIAIDNLSLTSTSGNGGGSTDICAGVSEWVSTRSYQVGERVTYQGSLFERIPSGWTNLGVCGTTTSFATTSEDSTGPPIALLTVFPNPLRGTILNVNHQNSGVQDYLIYNMLGQKVLKGTFSNTINVQELEAGVYMLNVKTQTIRFVKE